MLTIHDPELRREIAELREAGFAIAVFFQAETDRTPRSLRVAVSLPDAAHDKAMVKREREIPLDTVTSDIAPLVREFVRSAVKSLEQVR